MKINRIEVKQPLEQCPSCHHAHPNGLGLMMCGCRDCQILWGSVAYEWLAPPYQERFRELRALIEKAVRRSDER